MGIEGNGDIPHQGKLDLAKKMDPIEPLLSEHRDDGMCTVTPGGNHWKALIHMGMVKKREEAGIDHRFLDLEEAHGNGRTVGARHIMNVAAWKRRVNGGFSFTFGSLTQMVLSLSHRVCGGA